MIGTMQDPTLLVLTNIALGVICALFWLWVITAVCCELFRRWRTRACLPQGWPPEGARKPVVPEAWPPVAGRAKHLSGKRRPA